MTNTSRAALLASAAAVAFATTPVIASDFQTAAPSMLIGLNGFTATPLIGAGESAPSTDPRFPDGYTPTGIMDGIGVLPRDGQLRMYNNSELNLDDGFPYALNPFADEPLMITGARISEYRIRPDTREIRDSGIAYRRVIDRAGNRVDEAVQINLLPDDFADAFGNTFDNTVVGFSRFCSGMDIDGGTFGFVDDLYIAGEETADPVFHPFGGTFYALDPLQRTLHALPELGFGTWENLTPVTPPDENSVALLLGDDTAVQPNFNLPEEEREGTLVAAPLWLYIGDKNALPDDDPRAGGFLDRNGLASGTLYYFVPDDPMMSTPEEFNGTGNSITGTFRALEVVADETTPPDRIGPFGFKSGFQLRLEAMEGGAFQFSRPEDVGTNPEDGSQFVMTSTGRGGAFPSDDWGTTYLGTVDSAALTGTLSILYDGDDAGGGQFPSPDFGLRSPDNLDFGQNGLVYVQEDRANQINEFGGESGEEASIWQIDITTGELTRIAQIDRSVIFPAGSTDEDAGDIGAWESSGVLEVTDFFGAENTLLLVTVQAHGIEDGPIADLGLDEGGQILFLERE